MTQPAKEKRLKPLNNIIQVCFKCGRVDVYTDDGIVAIENFKNKLKEEVNDHPNYKHKSV